MAILMSAYYELYNKYTQMNASVLCFIIYHLDNCINDNL